MPASVSFLSPGQFQSTLPVWGATRHYWVNLALNLNISIHAPRVGSDAFRGPWSTIEALFQSTLPVWGATLGSDIAKVYG